MCAIAGILNLPVSEKVTGDMLATMERRGPDAKGQWKDDLCTLLHARLAVIDPEGGRQPMTLCWGEEIYTIVYNGELYNTDELRESLSKAGHSFLGHADTEVLLRGYAQWGEAVVEKCNGIFAFAVWEHRKKRLFLARDRMGVKPLFVKRQGSGLLFASEIKTILTYPDVKPALDIWGAAEILLLGPGRTPGCGVFYGIDEMEPGCCGWYENGKLTLKRYWRLTDREHTDSFEETAGKVRELVLDAIHRQMIADVPVGAFLSGGLDSSLIAAVCAEEMKKEGKRLTTFSVDYVDNEKYFVPNKFQPNSDGYYIRMMCGELDCDHHWCVLTPEDLVAELENATVARDLPGMADVDFSLLAFCRQIKPSVTVALSGECADEIFGGYPWFRDPAVRDREGFPWAQNSFQRISFLSESLADRLDPEAYIRERYDRTCRESDILPGTDAENTRIKQMVNLNQRWFMQTLLERKDRMSMYSGLEVRVPFCDHRIAEYLYGVPWEMKNYQEREKGLLRYAMEGLLPEEVLWRKKSPYPKTWDPKYLRLVTDRMEQLLDQKDAPLFQLVRRDALQGLLNAQYEWPWYGQLMKVPQTIAYFLQIDFWLRQYRIELLW